MPGGCRQASRMVEIRLLTSAATRVAIQPRENNGAVTPGMDVLERDVQGQSC